MAKDNQLIWVALIIGALWFMSTMNTQAPPPAATGTTTQQPTTCSLAPTIDVTAVDKLQPGTSVTPGSILARVGGIYKGAITSATAFGKGDSVELLLNKSGYINQVLPAITVGCGVNSISAQMPDSADATIVIKQDSTTLTDSAVAAASNMTKIAAGGTDTVTIEMTGTDKKVTGDIVFVVEISENANISSLTLADSVGNVVPEAKVPNFYVNSLGSPYKKAWLIPSFDNAVQKDFKLTMSAATGKTIVGAVYTTAYVKTSFVDNDGKFVTGIEDSLNVARYESTYDYDFMISAI